MRCILLLVCCTACACGRIGFDLLAFEDDVDGGASAVDGANPEDCPEDPNKDEPGICGCGVSDEDTSGSGLPDCLDPAAGCESLGATFCDGEPVGCPAALACAGMNYDLTAGPLSAGFTLARASTATYFAANRTLVVASPDTPRFEHYPTSGNPRGLIIEGAATNFVPDSGSLHSWAASEASVAASAVELAPDGVSLATELSPSTADALHYVSVTTDAQSVEQGYAISTFVKPLHTNYGLYMYVNGPSSSGTTFFELVFDLTSYVAGGNQISLSLWALAGVQVSVTIRPLANGWFRVAASLNQDLLPGATEVRFGVASRSTAAVGGTTAVPATVVGDGAPAFLLWGAQLEGSMGMSSYIPTAGGSASRAAEMLAYTPILPITGEFSYLMEADNRLDDLNPIRTILETESLSDPAHRHSITQDTGVLTVEANTGAGLSSGSTSGPKSWYRALVTAATAGWRAHVAGSALTIAPPVTASSRVDTFYIGGSGGAQKPFNGTLRRFVGWRVPLSNEAGNAVTQGNP